jgi:phage terminase large subunit GpA-like protein
VRSDLPWLPERYRQRPSRLTVSFRPSMGERRLYRKKPVKLPSAWAPKYRKITHGPLKGSYYDPDFMPHMNGIMDTAAESCVQEIVNCKAPQTGGSANWETFLGNRADVAPGDALIVYPDRDTARKRCVDYLQPMFRDSPRLRRLLTGVADDEASLRVKLKTMLVYMGWGGSVTSLGNVSVKYLLVDELDKCPEYPSKKEARFEALVAERTTAYDRFGSLKIWNSTPTAMPSRIVARLAGCDVIFDYHARCPDCGHIQLMEFSRIDFAGIRAPQEMLAGNHARYICAACGVLWDDRQRDRAVRVGAGWYARDEAERQRLAAAGKWLGQPVGLERAAYLKRHRPVKAGFHSPAWISPLNSLSKCAAAFLQGLRDEAEMIYFITQIEAGEYRHHKKQRKEEAILALRDDRPAGLVPGGNVVAGLVCGSDTQDNGHWFWICAVGWGLRPPRWLIRAGFVDSDEALARVAFADEYKDSAGVVYPVQLMVKDAMGHRTKEVYDFCLANPGRAIPYKGATGRRPSPYTVTTVDRYPGSNKPIPGGVRLYTCDSHYYKDQFAAKLQIKADDPGALRLHAEADEELARHLCAEIVDIHGLWQNPGNKANHLWDCAIMSLVAEDVLQLKFRQPVAQAAPPLPKKPAGPNPFTGGRRYYG